MFETRYSKSNKISKYIYASLFLATFLFFSFTPRQVIAENETTTTNADSNSLASLINDSQVKISGYALSLPGQFAKQYFYLYHNQAVIQVYNYWKKFPDFKINDYLEINAVYSASSKIKRFKTREASDIKIINSLITTPTPKPLDSVLLKLPDPNFINLEGKIKELKSSTIILNWQNQDITIDFKNIPDIVLTSYTIDDELKIKGIIFNNSGNITLYPTVISDISVIKTTPTSKTAMASLSQKNSSSTNVITGRETKSVFPWFKYAGLFLTCFIIFTIIRRR